MEFTKVLYTRKSCRAYQDLPVSDAELKTVLAAGNTAPVGLGAFGTLHITVIRNKAFIQALSRATCEFMKRDGDPMYNTPVLILVSSTPGTPPTIEFQNTAAVIENMLLAATDLGLGSVYIMGAVAALRTKPELMARLDLPEGHVPIAGLALGHPLDPLTRREPQKKITVSYLD